MKFEYESGITRISQLPHAPLPYIVPYPFTKSTVEAIVGNVTDPERGVNMERLKRVAENK